ncbi:lysosomal Pro-X carboxypeptidase-like [Homalodisca vitripennis]|uniref:lysosomal Pro-X carboxypeptidase-like n=1 Tax=Homalodisca vitripennis TaxID=197043 RepID=UPI001EEBB3A8|nr:lysosomal Pro-X carboxypeptidase-like [Homalodisca vitripennis]KAG8307504.1 hypothetical protein J6590_020635 [Homalodisca vitripennis]
MISLLCNVFVGIFLIVNIKQGDSLYVFKTKYFDTKLDHFNFLSNATFKLRYLINDTYWSPKSDSPIFFYTGNEGDITVFAQNTGFMWEIAPDFKALIVFAEHRYYGESLPFGNKSREPEHLGYLSSSQALMDYVELIAELKQNKQDNRHPVIVFGGSYGGMLAAWMRMKYPGTVAGAIAASAPIWQFTDMTPCNVYNRVLTSAFSLASRRCSDNIRKSWKAIDNITKTDDGKSWLNNTWRLCKPIKTSQNVSTLKDYLNDMYSNLAMVNYPYPATFLADLPPYPVRAFCENLRYEDLEGTKLLTALFAGVSVYFNYTGKAKCLDYSGAYQQGLDDTLWQYQACTEMVMPMCADGRYDMFEPSEWNLTEYAQNCYKAYKATPQPWLVKNLYGGKNIHTASNIIFSNGLLDPWSSGGVLRNVSATAQAIIMPDTAHHLDLRSSNPNDPMSVIIVRRYYRYIIRYWISQ